MRSSPSRLFVIALFSLRNLQVPNDAFDLYYYRPKARHRERTLSNPAVISQILSCTLLFVNLLDTRASLRKIIKIMFPSAFDMSPLPNNILCTQ